MEQASVWTKMGSWFRGGVVPVRSDETHRQDMGNASGDGLSGRPPAVTTSGPLGAPEAPLARRDANPDRESDSAVVGLIGSIREHLEEQSRWMERVAGSLDRAVENVEGLPDASSKQLGALTDILAQMEADRDVAKHLGETLSQLPRMADAQRETMVNVARQLDLLREGNERGTSTLADFQESVSTLGEANRAMTASIKEMQVGADARDERLADLLRVQTGRFTLIGWSAVGLVGLGVVVAIVGLFL